ncbi:MAG: terpene cyclase/mutase family protein [bacterium]|nr:terpene cyclase/mutase family protein [bacterium]
MKEFIIHRFAIALMTGVFLVSGCVTKTHPRPGPVTPPQPGAIDGSIKRGVEFLLKRQNANGSWGSPRNTHGRDIYAPVPSAHHGFRVAITSLCISALIEAGGDSPPVIKALKRAEAYLAENLPKVKRSSLSALYNNWAHAYGLRALVRMYNRIPDNPTRRKHILKLAAGQVDLLKRFESLGGGWGYYEFGYHTQKPFVKTTSFTTASVLIALHEVKSIGVDVPQKLIDRAKASLTHQQNPNFTYTYSRGLTSRRAVIINLPAGSLGRSQVCNLALRLTGDERISDDVIMTWLDRICARNGWLSRARKFPKPHESWFAVAGYFYYYGHFYAASNIEQLPLEQQGFYQDHLAKILMQIQEKDGSWWDFPLYDYHQQYGTALAIMSLHRCQRRVPRQVRSSQ